MLTNRKKLKNRKKRIKIILTSVLFVMFSCAILGYFLWTIIISKTRYISPLPLVLQSQSSMHIEKSIAKLETLLTEKGIEFSSVISSEKTYIVRLKSGEEVILSSEKDIQAQISSLQFILSRLTMEGRIFLRLDLTFDKPIIVFE